MHPQTIKTMCVHVHCRAQAAAEKAGLGADVSGVAAGTLVCVHVAAVPQDVAERVVQRVTAFQVLFRSDLLAGSLCITC